MQIIDEICAKFDRYKSQTAEVEFTRSGDVTYLLARVNNKERMPEYFLSIKTRDAQRPAVLVMPTKEISKEDVAQAIRNGGLLIPQILTNLGEHAHAASANAARPPSNRHQSVVESMNTTLMTFVVYDDGMPEFGVDPLAAGFYLRVRQASVIELTFMLDPLKVADAVEVGGSLVRLALESYPQAVKIIAERDPDLFALFEKSELSNPVNTAVAAAPGKSRSI